MTLEKLIIKGNTRLKGDVIISGAKNAAVAILPATLLIDGVCTINNLPNIMDVYSNMINGRPLLNMPNQ